jgi:quinol monooxygenase YgiN
MTFQNDGTAEFLRIFDQYQSRIRGAEGCTSLALLRDTSDARVFFTYSLWEKAEYIDQYRQSEVFGEVWPRVKTLFAEPAQAWSVESIVTL